MAYQAGPLSRGAADMAFVNKVAEIAQQHDVVINLKICADLRIAGKSDRLQDTIDCRARNLKRGMVIASLPIEPIAAKLPLNTMKPLLSYTDRLRKDMRRETCPYQAPVGRVMSAGRTQRSNSSGVT
ncbi:MAG: hypothetical protein AB1513_02775 [Pseudomonadota bacterium]